MGKKLILLSSILIVLLVFSGVYVIGGTQAYMRYQQANIENQKHCADQAPVHVCIDTPSGIFSAFYPSYLATHYPLFTVEYSSSKPMDLFVSVTITGFSQTQTRLAHASFVLQRLNFVPPMLNQGQVLRNLTNEVSTMLHVVVMDSNKHLYYLNDIPLLLHSRWLMLWTRANSERIAAWVTPNDKAVGDLVTKASNYLSNQQQPVPPALVGYNQATPQQVIDQVDAIYDALLGHMHYVQATIPYTDDDNDIDATEQIKLPFEVLQQQSGMCIELTVLLASAAERIGLHTEIIIIPGHAFLGVATTANNKQFAYWDAVDLNADIAGDSANIAADKVYTDSLQHHKIIAIIAISQARADGIGPMF
jgi:hypothetical protein